MNAPTILARNEQGNLAAAVLQAVAAKQHEEDLWKLDHRDMTGTIAESFDARENALSLFRSHGLDEAMLKRFVGDVL